MSELRRLVLVRHGETAGESSVRFHGASDVALSDEGRAQMRAAARTLRGQVFDLVVASTLRRSWEAARILSGGAPVRLEPGLAEIDFGRWEGLTEQEISDRDPLLYAEWKSGDPEFRFPGGEARGALRERVHAALARLEQSGASGILIATHKGPIRAICEKLVGTPYAEEIPLGGVVVLSRSGDGWRLGRQGSNPPGLEAA